MNWQQDLPSQGKSGYYWFQVIEAHNWEKPIIVFVSFDGAVENAYVNVPGFAGYKMLLDFVKVEEGQAVRWCGPIAEPKE